MYKENVWKKYDASLEKKAFDFAEGYIDFLSFGKTERLVAKESVEALEKAGFKSIDTFKELKKGDKVYFLNKNKTIVAFRIGEEPLEKGLRILGAHMDSPRMDFKEHPLYEKDGFALADTHYYGGIKKYQWVTIPLALHGVICKKDGTSVEVNVGEDPKDPVVGISDLLYHLSQDQLQKPGAKVIEGEALDVILGNKVLKGEEKNAAKAYLLKLLKDKYGVEEEDLVSAEIEVVPAGRARSFGLDSSMVAGYGQDDRCCSYSSLKAFIDAPNAKQTACLFLVDKEEIGSVGATSARSYFFENAVARLLELSGEKEVMWKVRNVLENSMMLSSDVSSALDPLYSSAYDSKNASFFAHGLVFNKYTGARGKSGSNDANPEYYAWIRKAMDENNVTWQSCEIGKVDQGGGGTIAYILGNYNMNVIDAGIPLLNMHAPMEIISKADLYEAYRGYIAFLTSK